MKWAVRQLHWLLGITVGLVLCLMGLSGATMAFEDDIMRALSQGVVEVAPRSAPSLTPDQLLARLQAQRPGATPTRLTLTPRPGGSARILYVPASGKGTERVYVDPYSGKVLGKATGEVFFEKVRLFHRYLLIPGQAKGPGRHITGTAAFCLIFFAISGLYLRWPRRALDWKAWLKPDLKLRGRNLFWSLHAVAGTWLFVVYLIMALTGLTWSYEWYKDVTTRMLTGKPPAPEAGEGSKATSKSNGGAPVPSMDTAWKVFQQHTPNGAETVIIPIPTKADAPVRFRYLDADAPHYRAVNEMRITRQGEVVKSTRYDTDPLGQQMVAGMLAIHRGMWFGLAGQVVFMLAALAMPLFAVTGWLLYLDRRKKKGEARRLSRALAAGGEGDQTPIVVAFASQSGVAEQVAWRSAAALADGGRQARVIPLARMTLADIGGAGVLLVVASTYGAGEPPDTARAFARKVLGETADLSELRYAVLALGHREYPDFCGFGRRLDAWFEAGGAQALFPRIEVDAEDAAALERWRRQLGTLGAVESTASWSAAGPKPWRLVERRHLNPGGEGEAWHVAFEPTDPTDLAWKAGDIVEVSARHPAYLVDGVLAACNLDGERTATVDGVEVSLRELLSRSELPRGQHLCADGFGALTPLAHRDYSIASLPSSGRIELLVRKTVLPDGRLGVGSGWITHHAPVGSEVMLRVRSNPGFHPPELSRPVILIGAGTGLAGLRAHLQHRRGTDHGGAWLIFGERSSRFDRPHADEIEAWRAEGVLSRCDLAFSRDSEEREYVQHRIARMAAEIGDWLTTRQAAVLVCGGLDMAHGVDEALAAIVGQARLEDMAAEGLYRRDVY